MNETALRFKGYLFSRPILGSFIPQRVQNLVVRTYARRKSFDFQFSAVEYAMQNCFSILRAELQSLQCYDGVIFFSVHMLPSNRAERTAILHEFLAQDKQLHFALEELSVIHQEDVSSLEEVFMVLALRDQVNMHAALKFC